jgi:hypothetical protein
MASRGQWFDEKVNGPRRRPWRKERRIMSNESTQPEQASFNTEEARAFALLLDSSIFDEFDRQMDDLFELLVGKWVHLAAPNADRIRRLVKPTKRPKSAS